MIVPPRNLSAKGMPPLGQYFSRPGKNALSGVNEVVLAQAG
jgi:hypothetical protein